MLSPTLERMKAAGLETNFAPLSEVADLCFEGIRANTFWIAVPNDLQADKIRARATSQIDQTDPEYLLEQTLLTTRPADAE